MFGSYYSENWLVRKGRSPEITKCILLFYLDLKKGYCDSQRPWLVILSSKLSGYYLLVGFDHF